MVKINGLLKTTLQDYPGKIACEIFTLGCNFNCTFCHNPAVVKGAKENVTNDEFFNWLEKRKGKLEGVVICGGEPTIYNDLPEFIFKIKQMGFAVKLDTNGSNPEMLKKLLEKHWVDYVAMDVKAPFWKYSQIIQKKGFIPDIKKSIKILLKSDVKYEFRTTVAPELSKEDILEIMNKIVSDAKQYILQEFVDETTLSTQRHLKVYSKRNLQSWLKEGPDTIKKKFVR